MRDRPRQVSARQCVRLRRSVSREGNRKLSRASHYLFSPAVIMRPVALMKAKRLSNASEEPSR